MKTIRKWICCFVAIAFAAQALPSMAAKPGQGQAKSYSVEFLLPAVELDANGNPVLDQNGNPVPNPNYAPGGVTGDQLIVPPVTVVAYFKNESPPSTAASNISSLQFTLAPSLVLVNDPNVISVVCPRAQCAVSGNTISVTNISPPIQGQEIYAVTLQVNTCVVANEAYIGNLNLYTGSSLTGNTFTKSLTDPTFQYQPTLSTRGSVYPINFGQQVTPTVTGISCGNIACLQSFAIGNEDPTLRTYRDVTGFRGLNADGTCSDTSHLSYFLTNKLGIATDADFPATQRSAHFVWPGDGTTTPVFAYKLTRDSTDTGLAWDVAWLPKPSLSPVLLDAGLLLCNGYKSGAEPAIDQLPLPSVYGTLTQDVKINTKQIKVDTGANPPPLITGSGLPIIIENERMLVTTITSSGWSVTRTNAQFHSAGKFVASTPFPLLDPSIQWPSPYVANTPAQMCLAWTDGTSAWIIDESDGWGAVR